MSRKSRYITESPVRKPVARWKAGVYIRLSREDEDAKEKDSQSVITQRRIMDKFLSEHPDIELFDYYIDDGYSGTTMDRPGFQRMKTDFESGTINCIIVKDLSRFARNDDESGRYIFVIFPFYKIRFISVNDRVDSFTDPNSINNLEILFKNIMHSEYSRDLSKKVRTASNIRRQHGEFIGAFCSYGYKKDPEDLHHLIIDEEAAERVRYIFRRYIETGNILRIVKELSEANVLTPLAYKKSKGCRITIPNRQINPTVWDYQSVRRILRNEVYLGHITQGTRQKISYKNKTIVMKDRSQWIKVEHTHEPIITQEEFDEVQRIMERNQRSRSQNVKHNIFAGKVFCGNCGATMSLTRSSSGSQLEYYHCNVAYIKKDACTPKRFRADALQRTILDVLNYHLKLCVDSVEVLNKINADLHKSATRHNSVVNNLRSEVVKLENCKSRLYEQYKEGVLTRGQYIEKKGEAEEKIKSIEQSISKISMGTTKKMELSDFPILSQFIRNHAFSELTREAITAFVEKIVVFSPTEIEVHLTFRDELERLREYLTCTPVQAEAAQEA